jgi:opacity protein-like surface antigen
MHSADGGTMKRILLGAGLCSLALAVAPAAAQVQGLPVYNSGVPRGIGIYADAGFPNEDAGKGTALGVTGKAGLGLFGVTATLASFNPDGPAGSNVSVGGSLNYRLFGGPLVPLSVTLQGGVGYVKPDTPAGDVTLWHFPIGVGFALVIPNPALAIKPWLAPRVDILRTSDGTSDTRTKFALSGGLELNLLNGFGLHAAYDLVTGTPGTPGVFGLGAHYSFRVPGL